MSNSQIDKVVNKARSYLARWDDDDLYRKRLQDVLGPAGNAGMKFDGIISMLTGLEALGTYRSTLAGVKFLSGDDTAWQDFLNGFVLSHWKKFATAAVVGRTKITTELQRFNSGFEPDIAFGLTSAIWLNKAQYLEAYRHWLPLIQQYKLLGQFGDDEDEEQIHFAYYLGAKCFRTAAPTQFPLREPQKTAVELLAGGKKPEAYQWLLDDHLKRAVHCLRYEKFPYFPAIGYGLIPVEVLALWALDGNYEEMSAQITHPLLSPLYKDRNALHAVHLEPEVKVIEEACQRFVGSYGGVTGR